MSKRQPYDITQLGQLLGVEIGKTFVSDPLLASTQRCSERGA